MKRRRPNSDSENNSQLKISKFFSSSNNSRKSNNTNTEVDCDRTISKSLQVGVPCSIDILEDALDKLDSNSLKTTSCISKLQKFVHNEDELNNKFLDGASETLISKCASQLEVPLTSKEVVNTSGSTYICSSLLDHKKYNLKLTPLEEQIVNLKRKHPDLLLIVECGYKYQMFGEDAEEAGRILNMVAYKKNNFLSCSFPLHRLPVHTKKLVFNGCKVGIVRQKETSALKAVGESKHTPFKRDLDIVYTKATYIDDFDGINVGDLNLPLCMTFIAEAFAKTDETVVQIGLLTFFTQESTVFYDYFQDDCARNRLDSRLTHFQPSEIILPDRNVTNQTLNLVRQFSDYKLSCGDFTRTEFTSYLDWLKASEVISEIYSGDIDMMTVVKDLPPVIQCCLAMAHDHLKQFKLERVIDTLKLNLKPYEVANEVLRMDGNCIRNLNLVPLNDGNRTRQEFGSVFHIINRTRTKFGARLLRSWLLKPLVHRGIIESRLEAVGWFVENDHREELVPIKKLLKSSNDLEKQLTAVLNNRSNPKEFHHLCNSWEQFRDVCIQYHSLYQELSFPSLLTELIDAVIQSLEIVGSFTQQLDEAAVRSGDKTKLFNLISDYPEVEMYTGKIRQVENQLQLLKPSICKTIGVMKIDYVSVAGDEYLIEVKNAFLRAVPSSWIKISATKQCCRFRSPQVQQLYEELCRSRELLKLAADEAWLQFQRQVALSYPTLKRANTAIGTLDCLISLAEVAKSDNYARPTFVEEAGVLDIAQGRHPIVSRALQKMSTAEYVPNDTNLKADEVRCMIITGPNMGGKSCLLSQVGIIVVLAQIGSFVPAARAKLSIFDSIFLRMGLHDEIYAGRSTFFMEMMETSTILLNSSKRSLVIIDELGRGTGTHDGSAIAYATLEYLVKKVCCLTLFVTHYPAVVELEVDVPNHVANYHMGYLLDEGQSSKGQVEEEQVLIFLYSLTPGKSPQSFGLNVARLAGIQSSIIDKAKLKSESFFMSATFQRDQILELKRILSS